MTQETLGAAQAILTLLAVVWSFTLGVYVLIHTRVHKGQPVVFRAIHAWLLKLCLFGFGFGFIIITVWQLLLGATPFVAFNLALGLALLYVAIFKTRMRRQRSDNDARG